MPKLTDFQSRINGNIYSYADIQFSVVGQLVAGVMAISYETEREKENFYGAGSEPIGVVYGQRKYSASITLTKQEIDNIKKAAPNGRLEDIPPFDFPVIYVNEAGGFTRDTLKNFEFIKVSQDYKKGDKGLEVKCDCLISGVVTTFS